MRAQCVPSGPVASAPAQGLGRGTGPASNQKGVQRSRGLGRATELGGFGFGGVKQWSVSNTMMFGDCLENWQGASTCALEKHVGKKNSAKIIGRRAVDWNGLNSIGSVEPNMSQLGNRGRMEGGTRGGGFERKKANGPGCAQLPDCGKSARISGPPFSPTILQTVGMGFVSSTRPFLKDDTLARMAGAT